MCFSYVHVPWPTPPGHMRKEEVARAPLSSGCTRRPFRVQLGYPNSILKLDPNPCGIILGRVALGADGFHSQRGRDDGSGGGGLSAAASRSLAARSHSHCRSRRSRYMHTSAAPYMHTSAAPYRDPQRRSVT